ncbi:cAMP-responsive element-binding protein-like 2 [Ctenodactylus gundi]
MDDSKVGGGKVKKPGKRGRKPAKIDLKAKLERSRQSARECRARKKLRYQYLEELVSSRERAICALREELEMYKQWCMAMDQGKIPSEIKALLTGEENRSQQNPGRHTKTGKTDASSNSCEYNPWGTIFKGVPQGLSSPASVLAPHRKRTFTKSGGKKAKGNDGQALLQREEESSQGAKQKMDVDQAPPLLEQSRPKKTVVPMNLFNQQNNNSVCQ